MPPSIPAEVLRHFGVQVVGDLGGRVNRHWQVQRRSEALVLRRWAGTLVDVGWEREVRARIAGLGWPVAPDSEEVYEQDGALWSLAPLLPGQPWPEKNTPEEQRQRGRLLAEFHQATCPLSVPQRPGWRRAEVILHDSALEQVLQACPDAQEARLYLWHLHRARQLAADLRLADCPEQLLHGDFTQWNLLFQDGGLSGLLDFELAHLNHRVADFCLAWRGQYDDVIHAYHAISPLEDVEWGMLTPVWWAFLLQGIAHTLRQGQRDDGWTARMLLRRSPLIPVETYPPSQ